MHEWLEFDREKEAQKVADTLRNTLIRYKRRGFILGISGGIDSSVTLALCKLAVGAERIFTLQMPEKHSSEETALLSELVVKHFGVRTEHADISEILESVGFYNRYTEAVRIVVPEYGPGWKSKIVTSSIFKKKGITTFSIVIQDKDKKTNTRRLPLKAYLEIVAATNFKQRIRKMLEYYHADRLNYIVAGTPNRLEYDQGFFVKCGDGAADIKPIAHLYKSQVYALAQHLGVPETICNRPPTTDTYSLAQGQDEFYFTLPYFKMDICLYGKNNSISTNEVASAADLSVEEVELVYKDIDRKRATTVYLHESPIIVSDVPEIRH